MKKKLEAMSVELRELVVYQSPPELGALWTDVNKMMEELGKQQEVHLRRKVRQEALELQRKEKLMRTLKADAYLGGLFVFLLIFLGCMFAIIAHDAERRWPHLHDHPYSYAYAEIRKQEIAKALEEGNKRADIRDKQITDALTPRKYINNE